MSDCEAVVRHAEDLGLAAEVGEQARKAAHVRFIQGRCPLRKEPAHYPEERVEDEGIGHQPRPRNSMSRDGRVWHMNTPPSTALPLRCTSSKHSCEGLSA